MENIVDLAVQKILEEYSPHTILLYGSRARGDFTELSDIDLACFCEISSSIKKALLFHGVYLDLWVYPTDAMNQLTEESLRFSGAILKRDLLGYGKSYLERIEQYEAKGPEQISFAELEHTKLWIEKMLSRIGSGDLESNFRRTWLQFELLEIYFNFRRLWFAGSKRSFKYLKEQDPVAYKLFQQAYSQPENIEALSELAQYVKNV